MKKLILSFVVAVLAFSSFAMQATVVSAKGKAEVQNGDSWVALKAGDALDQGSVIQTGFKSEVVLKIKESTVTVAPLSRITLQTLAEREGLAGAQGKDETAIFLDTGSLKSNVQKSNDRRVGFTVRSPVATASVRGTEFAFAMKYKSVELNASQGKVAFWKNTKESEQALDSATDSPVDAPSEGNEPRDISEYAPQNAIVVSKGEGASVSTAGGMAPPAKIARTAANSIGEGTKSAADAERPPVAFGAAPESKGSAASTKGSLSVTVTYEKK